MKIQEIHKWNVTPQEAIQIQNKLRKLVITKNVVHTVQRIAGVDISVKDEIARAAVVILSFPNLEPLEQKIITKPIEFGYIPGLLSFRESPSIIQAFEEISLEPDIVFIDGQGIAHPRRFGIASHIGLLLNKPTIGCAKSLLCGKYEEPNEKAGSYTYIKDKDEVIGAALRTKDKTNVVYVSIGHKIDLAQAIEYTLKCSKGYRIPEPTRLADLAAGGVEIVKSNSRQLSLGF